jgi:hypothetical protein
MTSSAIASKSNSALLAGKILSLIGSTTSNWMAVARLK